MRIFGHVARKGSARIIAEDDPVKYSAKIGEHSFSLEVVEGRLTVDGREADVSFTRAGPAAYAMIVDGRSCRILIERGMDAHELRVTVDGQAADLELRDEHNLLMDRLHAATGSQRGVKHVRAPMPGLVRAVHVGVGDHVESGHGLIVLEAMKMENELRAEAPGIVRSLSVSPGETVEKNQMLIEIGPADE